MRFNLLLLVFCCFCCLQTSMAMGFSTMYSATTATQGSQE